MNIGDHLERGLAAVGVTKQRVSRMLGRRCKCKERQRRLNEAEYPRVEIKETRVSNYIRDTERWIERLRTGINGEPREPLELP